MQNPDPVPYTPHFRDVLKREYADLWLRRPQEALDDAGPAAETGEKAPPSLYGVALSGGGIRSASFCLGALQALDQHGLAERIDYLSTVSGGGYTGASMISAMRQNGERFPFSPGSASDMHDNEPVNNLRDNSRFLAPRGATDLLISLVVILRGLVVNVTLLLAFLLLPLATMMILANPTKEHLERSIVQDLAEYWVPASLRDDALFKQALPYISDTFIMSKSLAILLFVVLVVWALRRSFSEGRGQAHDITVPEQESQGALWGRRLVVALAVTLFLELQPPILLWLMNALDAHNAALSDETARQSLTGMIGTIAAALVALTATFRTTFVGWIQKALTSESIAAKLKALLARSMIYTAGLVLPLMIYGAFLMITIWGIEPSLCAPVPLELTKDDRVCACVVDSYPLTPEILAVANISVLLALSFAFVFVFLAAITIRDLAQDAIDFVVAAIVSVLATVVLFTLARKYAGTAAMPEMNSFSNVLGYSIGIIILVRFVGLVLFASDSRRSWGERLRAFIFSGWGLALTSLFLLLFLFMSAIATREGAGDASVTWVVLLRYVISMLLVLLVGWQFTENANGLHRLYRDRLSTAFRLGQPDNVPLLLSDLDDSSPYLLVNATLNVREGDRTRDENPTSLPDAPRKTDPARRGRNAEFFLFSRFFVGSASTGYASTKNMESIDHRLDLATAVAISGAAVSSSMGRIKIGLLGPTLALLNLRLGYWLTNPNEFKKAGFGAVAGEKPKRSWHDALRLYLFAEAFGQLRSDSSRVYVTDGGHIDNIGLYQLLKRRCKFIVVIDSEADPAMTFGAFSDLQRFARIDEGVRVTLNWMPIRDAALARMADRTKQVAPGEAAHDQHFAIGKIIYEKEAGDDGKTDEQEEGLLIYVKASMTGDEPDYVLDYERRYPLFPHESTGDQFFSEEQMEAYRALGYHCVARFLGTERKDLNGDAERGGSKSGPITRMLRELKATASTTKLMEPRPMRAR
ncbi:MAG TPA: patatin-like phospholipase family protein [Rhizobiaceae bacterium]|nr:patatin-like phospholipase family protein [Rhizobiaceae bacterium]